MDTLAVRGDEGRSSTAISSRGAVKHVLIRRFSEWGNPTHGNMGDSKESEPRELKHLST